MEQTAFRTAKSVRTFETVLTAAVELFTTKGYEATTIRDIARASGLGLGALYYYVRSKEELVLRFYSQINAEVQADFREQAEIPSSLPDALTRFLELKLERLQPYRSLMQVVMKEAISPDSPLSPLHPASKATLAGSLALFREMIVRADAARDGEIEDMTRTLWVGHMAVLAYWLHDRSPEYRATHRAIATLASLVRFTTVMRRLPGFGSLRRQVYDLTAALFARSEAQ